MQSGKAKTEAELGHARAALFTEPPPRYSEATLVKALEEKGIGRPSTYAAIMTTIQEREYVEKVESRFHPTRWRNRERSFDRGLTAYSTLPIRPGWRRPRRN
ncbi:MAG: hypothetical protein IPM25_03430 [Chloracidobacterium sp.]|nr:hypothetical protein [Chloracidobacterium sp.]